MLYTPYHTFISTENATLGKICAAVTVMFNKYKNTKNSISYVMQIPVLPALPVRPDRCTYVSTSVLPLTLHGGFD